MTSTYNLRRMGLVAIWAIAITASAPHLAHAGDTRICAAFDLSTTTQAVICAEAPTQPATVSNIALEQRKRITVDLPLDSDPRRPVQGPYPRISPMPVRTTVSVPPLSKDAHRAIRQVENRQQWILHGPTHNT